MKRLVFCLGLAVGIMSAAAQNFPTNSNFRIEMGPGQLNPLQGASSTPWYIEDYIDELTVPDDITLLNPGGNLFFDHNAGTPSIPYHYGKFFFDGMSDIGIDTGIVMASGRVAYCGGVPGVGPGFWPGIPHAAQYHCSGPQAYAVNCTAEASIAHIHRDTQYADLMAINNGDSIWDANILEFDFVPKGSVIKLEYVFASEEFTRVDCNGPTDVMGIFLSGPGINGQQNIAVLPGTNTPVNPHTVWPANSPCHTENPAASPYYVDNTNGENVIYDGFTTVLTAAAYVNPCDTYHLRVAVADGALHPYDTTFIIMASNSNQDPFDSLNNASIGSIHGRMLYDSGIFLKSRSFRSTDSLWIEALGGTNSSSDHPYVVRGCLDGKLRVHSATAWPLDRELELDIQGTAVMGTDYQAFNTTVTIPANETFVDIEIVPLSGGLGTTATLIARLKSPYGACANLGNYLDADTLLITDGYYIAAEPQDTTICAGCSAQLRVQGEDFLDYSWSPGTGLDNPNTKEPVASPSGSTQYVVTATPPTGYPCAGSSDSVTINVGSSGIDEVGTKSQLQVYPNPFTTGFTITLKDDPGNIPHALSIYDVMGRKVYSDQGTVNRINTRLESVGESWPSGAYYIELSKGAEGIIYRQQLTKH